MAYNLGDIVVRLKANTSDLESGLRRAEQQTSGFSNTMGKIGGFAKSAGIALGIAGAAAATFSIKSAASFEQTRIGLENMLGSADKARKLLSQISDFAAKTPFEFPELAQATRQLVAFGFSAEDAFNTISQLGDVSAAVGAPINDLAYLMGTLKTQGRAMMIDIRQFAQRGIPIYEYLGKVLGKNTAEISEMITAGKIGFPEVQKAFKAMTAEGGAFHDTMSKQSKSLSGLFSTLKDNIGFAARELVGITKEGDIKEGSILAKVKTFVDSMNTVLPTAIASFKNFLSEIGKLINDARDFLIPILDKLKQLFQQMLPNINALWQSIKDRLLPQLMEVWKTIEPGFTTALKVLGVLIGSFVVGFIWAFINVLNVAISVLGGVIRVVNNLIKWFGNLIGVVINTIKTVGSWFMRLPGYVESAINAVIGWFKKLPGMITRSISGVTEAIIKPFRSAFDWIKEQVTKVKDVVKGLSPGNIVSGIGNKVKGLIPSFATGVDNFKGGLAYVHSGEVLANLSKGTSVIPADRVGNIGNKSINIYGDIRIDSKQDADYFFKRIDRNAQLERMGLSPT